MPILKTEVVSMLPAPRAVSVPGLGEVMLHPLTLSERLEYITQARNGNNYAHIPILLAQVIRDANGEPLFSVEQWEVWGGSHVSAAMDLFNQANESAGLNIEAAEKNSPAPTSN